MYFNLSDTASNLLDAVLPLARAHEAYLVGITVIPQLHMYAALAGEYSAGLIDAQRSTFQKQAELIGAAFQSRTKTEGVAAEWRCPDASPIGVAATVVDLATGADIVVAKHASPDSTWDALPAVPERLLMESKRPLILMPQAGGGSLAARRVTIGWKRRAEAARAAFDALPILCNAEHVEMVTVDDGSEETALALSSADDIAAALGRHGVEVEIAAVSSDGQSEGEVLLERAHDQESDLLVIGTYGYSRVSEFMFGGVTRHVLTHMSLPTFMVH